MAQSIHRGFGKGTADGNRYGSCDDDVIDFLNPNICEVIIVYFLLMSPVLEKLEQTGGETVQYFLFRYKSFTGQPKASKYQQAGNRQ